MIIITIIMRVCGDFLCFASLHSDAGVKPRREGKSVAATFDRPGSFWPRGSAAQLQGLRRASTTTWRAFECVCEREPRVMLFGAGKSPLLMKELRNNDNSRVVVGFQPKSLVLTLWLHMKSHALYCSFNSRTWFPSRKNWTDYRSKSPTMGEKWRN